MKTPLKPILLLFLLLLNFPALAQWSLVEKEFGSRSILAVEELNGSLYVSMADYSSQRKIFRSDDHGQTWLQTGDGLFGFALDEFGALGSTIFGLSINDGTLFRSDDQGENWTTLKNNMAPKQYSSFAIKDQTIIIGTSHGQLYRSTDLGDTWTLVDDQTSCSLIYSVTSTQDAILASTCQDVLVSLDDGLTWAPGSTAQPGIGLKVIEGKGDIVYGTDGYRVYHTVNNGAIWTLINQNLNLNDVKRAIAISGNTVLLATQQKDVFGKERTEQFWQEDNLGLRNQWVYDFAVTSDYIFAATEKGLFRRDSSHPTHVDQQEVSVASLKVFPNPNTGLFQLSFDTEEQILPVFILDLSGKLVHQTNWTVGAPIDLQDLPKGIYLLEIRHEKGVAHSKVVIE